MASAEPTARGGHVAGRAVRPGHYFVRRGDLYLSEHKVSRAGLAQAMRYRPDKGGSMALRVVALDDYQGLVAEYRLDGQPAGAQWTAIREHLTGGELVAALNGADVAVAMRERTRFDGELFAQLPDLKLLVTTGRANAAIDLNAAADHGVTVSGTGGPRSANTAELTWALILSLARHLSAEMAAVRNGGWQHTVGMDLMG